MGKYVEVIKKFPNDTNIVKTYYDTVSKAGGTIKFAHESDGKFVVCAVVPSSIVEIDITGGYVSADKVIE